jgi:hypothetical protein
VKKVLCSYATLELAQLLNLHQLSSSLAQIHAGVCHFLTTCQKDSPHSYLHDFKAVDSSPYG